MSLNSESQISKELLAEIGVECASRLVNFQMGMVTYLNAKIPDWKPTANIACTEGSSRLLDYGGQGQNIVLIPPLINKANVLDFSAELSFAKKLTSFARVFLVDWGVASDSEVGFDFASYHQRLANLLGKIKGEYHLFGYCMGGLFALKHANSARSIIIAATPWDFSYLKDKALYFNDIADSVKSSFIPPEMIQALFFSIDPWRVVNKFSQLPKKTASQQNDFCLIEKWVNDGVPMPKPLFKQCIQNWIINADMPVNLGEIAVPVLAACPKNDKIVPLSSSLAVAAELGSCTIQQFDSGHIGLVSKDIMIKTIENWLKNHA